MIRARQIAIAIAVIAGIAILLTWLVVFSRLFAEPRGFLAAQMLSERLAQKVRIDGGVDVSFVSGLRILAKDIEVSRDTSSEIEKVDIGQLGFALDWRALSNGKIRVSEIQVDGVRGEIHVASDVAEQAETANTTETASTGGLGTQIGALKEFVTDRQIKVSDFEFLYENARNGVDLDLQLTTVLLAQSAAQDPWTLDAKGDLNGQSITIDGTFPDAKPIEINAVTDEINLKVDATPDPDGFASGYTANISADVEALAQLLDILKLQKTIAGTGKASATVKSSGGKHSISDLDVTVALDGGQNVTLTGDLGELRDLDDATLKVDISLYEADDMPPPAKLRRDLKLTGFEMVLIAQPDGIPLRRMKVQTNGFVLNTHGRGPPPIVISEIKITPDGLLDLGDVELRIGPPGSYFAVFKGSIGDALRVEGIDVDATLDLPMTVLLKPDQFQNSDTLGKVTGGFNLSGDSKTLALSNLKAQAQGSDLIQLDVTGSAGNILQLSALSLDVSADVPSGAKLLSALSLSPVSTGEMKLNTKLSGDGKQWQSQTKVSVAKSNLDISLSAETSQTQPELDGQIESTLIRLQDVQHIIALAREMEPPGHDKAKSDGIFTDVTLEPVTSQMLQSGLDMDIKIDIQKLEGVVGTTSLKTEFILKKEKATVGPVKFDYDGGKFDVTGSVDLAKNPNIVAVKGTADGWNFGTILQELNIKKHGSGILNASFDLAGAHRSVSEFTKTASGEILVSMRNGRIQTRLINLAGLGVLPWLFTDAHGKVAPIVCLRAPLRFERGKIAIKEAALETDRVQVVVNGDVDLPHKTIDVTGEPRPIGKPLARSPWPFVVSGSLEHPKLSLKKGPHRQRRSDGAKNMPQERKLCIPDILQLR